MKFQCDLMIIQKWFIFGLVFFDVGVRGTSGSRERPSGVVRRLFEPNRYTCDQL